ncbi:MAG: F420-nonreducing hydrogenase [Elusimicrobia bacterium RIFOXYA12_FULL_51_18]|nr:MAG: F420-nonreducing hydrogenase [Elusimicrobia bacterium RIFOXYA12_FULL_51_18]OGS32518.1 MAG: F420-nonreducing hydrogenase [Elusimicrobia bacterium RIFOXYA2_FULL_53_38]
MDTNAQKVWNQAHQQANSGRRTVTIDPITRLEGHGKIEIFMNDQGNVDRAYLQIPELRGFEVFCQGRPAEDMPQLTSRICGVCPTAHHMAAAKTLDDLYGVECHPVGRKIRELVYNAFMFEDHALHVYVLGGPDFIVGPDAPKEQRNILGVIGKVGLDVGKKVISTRRRVREIINYVGGKVIHPVMGLPGGVAKGIAPSEIAKFREVAKDALEFAKFTLQVFHDIVLKNDAYVKIITSDAFTHKTYYMGMVDKNNKVNFYDGELRVVTPEGKEFAKFPVQDYLEHIAEHVEPWSYIKFPFLKKVGWHGFTEGGASGVFAVAPMARLNAADGMATPEAQRAYEEYFKVLGGKPVHHTLANHWARVVEMIQAAERMVELTNDPELTGKEFRTVPAKTPKAGVGAVEAPRGTLIHHYETDENGLILRSNLIVATLNNSARIAMSVDKAAKGLIKDGKVNDGLLNMVEMAFRAYDPCFGCATHTLPGEMPLVVTLRDMKGEIIREIRR